MSNSVAETAEPRSPVIGVNGIIVLDVRGNVHADLDGIRSRLH
jgi:hypothetical protein